MAEEQDWKALYEQKCNEHEELRKQYEDFVASSGELESALERELTMAQDENGTVCCVTKPDC
jgi:hypothetical protein